MPNERHKPLDQLRRLLQAGDDSALLDFTRGQRRSLSYLTALTYDDDPNLAWAAIRGLGLTVAELTDHDPEFVRGHLRRLAWLLSDESGGIGWRAPEALGVIISARPDCFADFIPILISLLDMEAEDAVRFRAGYLWAIGRLARSAPAAAGQALPWVLPCLDDPEPQTRGLALWCLGQFPERPALPSARLRQLAEDRALATIFTQAGLQTISLSELAKRLLD